MEQNFVALADIGRHCNTYLNLNLIRQASLKADGSCEIMFSEEHRVTLSGVAALALIERLSERSTALNGEPLTFPITNPQA